MKYLKRFNESRTSDVLDSVLANANAAKNALPEFASAISKLINTNYEIDYVNEIELFDVIKKYIKDIPYVDVFSNDKSSTESLIKYIVNFGYSTSYYSEVDGSRFEFDYDDFMEDVFNVAKFDRISNKKLYYNGPDILSSSVLASGLTIEETIKRIRKTIESHYEDDSDAELKIILGKVYDYGYGLGRDQGYYDKMEKMGARNMDLDNIKPLSLNKDNLSPETLALIRKLFKE